MNLVWRSRGQLPVVVALLVAVAMAPLAEASPPPRRVLHQPPGLMDVDGSAVVEVALIGPHGRPDEQAARVYAHVHRAGVWTERSLDGLAVLMPGRYAKFEESSGFLVSIDSYNYRSPSVPLPDATEIPAEEPVEEAEDPGSVTPPETEPADETVQAEEVATG